MRIDQARQLARRWVAEAGAGLPGFGGAFLTGSALWADGDAELPPSSDVDVTVIADPPVSIGKFMYEGVLLEVSSLPGIGSADEVLGDYHLAGSFHLPCVLADPTGRLTELQRAVARDFAARPWVLARCTAAMDRVRGWITGVDAAAPLPGQVTSWLFGTGVTTHVLLVAGLRNPTVRKRYAAVRELLAEHGRLDYHEVLLDLLGCAELSPERVERHLTALETAFDAAAPVRAPSYRFASDITEVSRPVAIDGSRELIRRGLHREAVFWMVATYARCLTKRAAAGLSGYEDGFMELLGDLDAATTADRRRRGDRVLSALPGLWRTALTLC
ncbi:hypothetical protein ETD86_06695 [Nonomuraea turkmeniaca]|uniref:Nucleotidyltransferase domain-containing protein n=1 Tax=Nonomuraea turkmeniaca TaxID=103838 RepID=A0A5S4FSV5_9ACTN|nr:hypothetical protein [Nonomuraea turkmeniaca]TMR23836.1 hypothetical protein ETD86_06695 [Nonomuraea turkmeniaca]